MARVAKERTFKVVFDLDGTLFDTMPGIAGDLFVMFNELGASPVSEDEFVRRFASRFDAVFAELCSHGRTRDDVYAEWVARAVRRTGQQRPFAGVGRLLERLDRARAELFIWTTRDTATTRVLLESVGWSRAFVDYRCGDSGAPPKPEPGALESMLGSDYPRTRVAVVGDGVSDIEAGKAFGCHTIGAAWCGSASSARLIAAGADSIATTPGSCWETLLSFFASSGAEHRR